MIDFSVVFSYAHGVIAICGMLFNALLTYLALFQTPRVIKSYATLIVNFAITDFCACLFDFFVQQRLIPSDLSLAYISNGFCHHFGPTTCYVGYSLMLHCFSHSLWSLLLSFSYRCYILYKPAPTRPVLVLIIFLIYTPSLLQFVSFLWAQDDPDEMREILTKHFPAYNLTEHTVYGTKNIICFSALFTILHMTLPITPVYICILILRRKITSRLSVNGVNITKETRNMHSQLLMALTYQAAIPGFYLFGVTSYAIGQFGIYNHPALEYFTFSSFLLIPLLSPLASFIFVTPYRRFIMHYFFKTTRVEPGESSLTRNIYTSNAYTG
ncbi:G_PROTEIN_RECEP_F1_2 domain-containing protein [Caenorhabditis elegans]|uniref:G_PROTEIN_RECEP_F1_2 domain-containing protein n=1 Tax=Caenorhabditis elegans TaxID=6239 RepID=Q95ZX2_CAEEL|nr:G_PROTEIN_RECEP_F1_2 domain-containing protein [Caenorhabditis elegans]CCD62222.1 G_PROTEIN_RECEP_F1_2 domain-containing protein [Caenorhabditis elegans]|eukprot:NP_500838.1 Serpentine Receptor, class D (delta) [Caenorhabditis elegans]